METMVGTIFFYVSSTQELRLFLFLIGKSICGGDAGGPMVVQHDGKLKQVAIGSYTISAGCEFGFPDVFTRTSSFLVWLEENSSFIADP